MKFGSVFKLVNTHTIYEHEPYSAGDANNDTHLACYYT